VECRVGRRLRAYRPGRREEEEEEAEAEDSTDTDEDDGRQRGDELRRQRHRRQALARKETPYQNRTTRAYVWDRLLSSSATGVIVLRLFLSSGVGVVPVDGQHASRSYCLFHFQRSYGRNGMIGEGQPTANKPDPSRCW
jgi:hypothetical protein